MPEASKGLFVETGKPTNPGWCNAHVVLHLFASVDSILFNGGHLTTTEH